MRSVACVTSMVLLAIVLGCSGKGPRPVPVSGTVTVDGRPLAGGAITVAPANGRAAGGRIGPDGRFTLSTWQLGDGVAAGTHRVEVIATKPMAGNRRQWLVPKNVRSLTTSPLRLEVTGPTTSAVIAIETDGEALEIESLDGTTVGEGLFLPGS
jgi:hypothetical protein